jgi:hypothetical protein
LVVDRQPTAVIRNLAVTCPPSSLPSPFWVVRARCTVQIRVTA